MIVVHEFIKKLKESATCPKALSTWLKMPKVMAPAMIVGPIARYGKNWLALMNA